MGLMLVVGTIQTQQMSSTLGGLQSLNAAEIRAILVKTLLILPERSLVLVKGGAASSRRKP